MMTEIDTILCGDALTTLRSLPDGIAHCCITSPPYLGLRSYLAEGDPRKPFEIGLEATIEEYVAKMVEVFREVKRVLRPDGTLWLNLGDAYANDGKWGGRTSGKHAKGLHGDDAGVGRAKRKTGLKPKDLMGLPWRVAFALQSDGWWLRSDIIYAKPNPMPESVQDRPTRAHEYIFLLSASQRYYYDAAAIRESPARSSLARIRQPNFDQQKGGAKDYGASGGNSNRSMRRALEHFADKQRGHGRRHAGFNDRWDAMPKAEQQAYGANKRDVWVCAPEPWSGAHFATFPTRLIEPCILAGCPSGGIVLDPFFGRGTVGRVARRHSRHYIGIDLNEQYCEMAEAFIAEERQPVLWTA